MSLEITPSGELVKESLISINTFIDWWRKKENLDEFEIDSLKNTFNGRAPETSMLNWLHEFREKIKKHLILSYEVGVPALPAEVWMDYIHIFREYAKEWYVTEDNREG